VLISFICICLLYVVRANSHPLSADSSEKRSHIVIQPGIFLSDPDLTSDTSSCIIPFTRAGKLILVKGRADTTEGNFILDTGSPNLVLNTTYFRDYPLTEGSQGEQTNINGRGDRALRTAVKSFRLGTFTYHYAEADLVNLGHIENSKGTKILGLLGVSLFKQCEIIIDYEKNLIYLHHIGRKERNTYQHAMLADPKNYHSYPIDIKDNRILIKTDMANRSLQFVIDYAAETNIIDSRLPEKILDSVDISGRIILTGAGSKKVEALSGILNSFRLPGLDVGTLPVIITNLENTCFGQENCINGVLGYDFLSRYKLGFNFIKRKMYILK
jgi:hypothetical protein